MRKLRLGEHDEVTDHRPLKKVKLASRWKLSGCPPHSASALGGDAMQSYGQVADKKH